MRSLSYALLCTSFLVVLAGCSGRRPTAPASGGAAEPTAPASVASDTGAPFSVDVGQTVTLNAAGDQFRFDRVVSDNRCPRNVACVQQGAAIVNVTYIAEDFPTTYTLDILGGVTPTSRPGSHRWLEARGYRFTLLGLDPYPDLQNPGAEQTPTAITVKVEPLSRVRPGG